MLGPLCVGCMRVCELITQFTGCLSRLNGGVTCCRCQSVRPATPWSRSSTHGFASVCTITSAGQPCRTDPFHGNRGWGSIRSTAYFITTNVVILRPRNARSSWVVSASTTQLSDIERHWCLKFLRNLPELAVEMLDGILANGINASIHWVTLNNSANNSLLTVAFPFYDPSIKAKYRKKLSQHATWVASAACYCIILACVISALRFPRSEKIFRTVIILMQKFFLS